DLREGATRFRLPAGPHLAASDEGVPGLAELGVLLRASDELVAGGVTDDDAFAALVAAGSSIGGAQPKAAVRGWGEAPAIAKFTRPALGTEPHWDVVGWERVTQLLARRCGLDTVPSGLVRAGGTRADGTAAGGSAAGRGKEGGGEGAGGGNVFVIERFDRCAGRRIGFATAFTMLGAIERDDAHSYLEIVEVLRAHSPRPQRDLEELFRRVVFSILVANTDEHLRNHGFLRRGGGWALSPLYDVNPNPRSEGLLMTAVDEADHSASIELAASSAESYGLSARRGCEVIGEVEAGTRPWREVAASLCLRPEEVELMAAAFESPERGVAARLAGLAGRAAGGPGGRGATGNRSSRAMALDTGSATALGGASDAGSATA
ncbi:MAG TPA: HipA domain-containing protein, partial [Acidimicrobiales bacterium]|nr:HipA domain-containing protein [Acidimicrobiales bacterium]